MEYLIESLEVGKIMFRLLRYFSLTSAIAMAALTAVLVFGFQKHITNMLTERTAEQNIAMTRVMLPFVILLSERFTSGCCSTKKARLSSRPIRSNSSVRSIIPIIPNFSIFMATCGLPNCRQPLPFINKKKTPSCFCNWNRKTSVTNG